MQESVRTADRLDGYARPAESGPEPKRLRQSVRLCRYHHNLNIGNTLVQRLPRLPHPPLHLRICCVLRPPRDSNAQARLFVGQGRDGGQFCASYSRRSDSKWQIGEGREQLLTGIRKETKNLLQDKRALRPLTVEKSRQVKREHSDGIVPSRLVLITKVEDSGEEIVDGSVDGSW